MSTRDSEIAEIRERVADDYATIPQPDTWLRTQDARALVVRITALEAELQAAQLRPIQGSLKWSIEKMEQRAIDNFRTKLVAAVREITMTVPPTAERDGYFRTPLQVRDEAVALIEATEL